MLSVLETIKQALSKLDHIKIDKNAVRALAESVTKNDLQVSEISLSKYDWDKGKLIELTFLFNTINFCFWSKPNKPKWTIANDNLDGAVALFRSLEKGLKDNPDLLSPDELADMQLGTLRTLLQGNVTIPLISERLININNFGKIVENKYGGSITGLLDKTDYDACVLAKLLADNFKCFDDTSTYKDIKIGFYKRAQLNSKMIHDVLVSTGEKGLTNLDKLTAFADYKIPQILRNLGVLVFSDELSQKVDNYELIEADSVYENEIRIATVWAVENIMQELKEKYADVTSSHVDNMLWLRSQVKNKDDKPYHRTLTTAY
ncbi:MAG: queuosine salvage family protein [bacterium]